MLAASRGLQRIAESSTLIDNQAQSRGRITVDELAAYFYDHVVLAYAKYRKVKFDGEMGNSNDRREAINAAIALYHLREHLPDLHKMPREHLVSNCPDYGLLGDIVDASKHCVLTKYTSTRKVLSADSICEVRVVTSYEDELGEYRHGEKLVEVNLTDGSKRDLYDVLTNVLNMWLRELNRIGAIDCRKPFSAMREPMISRKDAKNISLKITQGFRWKQRFRFQQFNYETNSIEPVDLSNASKIIFTLRKPQSFEIEMGDETGLKQSRTIELSCEESIALRQITDDELRNKFVFEIAEKRGIV